MISLPKRLLAGAFTVAALGGSLALATPAQAHATEECRTVSGRGWGCVASGHHWARVRDTSADNWGVRIHLWNNLGQKFVVGDGNGSASGDGGRHTVRADEVYTFFQVCAGENGVDTRCSNKVPA